MSSIFIHANGKVEMTYSIKHSCTSALLIAALSDIIGTTHFLLMSELSRFAFITYTHTYEALRRQLRLTFLCKLHQRNLT